MEIGSKLQTVRALFRLSGDDIKKRTGLSHSYLSRVESGRIVDPRLSSVLSIVKGLGCKIKIVPLNEADKCGDDIDISECFKATESVRTLQISKVSLHSPQVLPQTPSPSPQYNIYISEDQIKKDKKNNDEIAQEMVEIWNDLVCDKVPLTKIRADHLWGIYHINFSESMDKWRDFCSMVASTPFLMGKVSKFKARLDWSVREENMEKILSGVYERSNGDAAFKSAEKYAVIQCEEIVGDDIWSRVRRCLKASLGDGVYLSWINPLSVIVGDNSVTLKTNGKFSKDYINTHLIHEIRKVFVANGCDKGIEITL